MLQRDYVTATIWLLISLALLLAGCGQDGAATPSPEPEATMAQALRPINDATISAATQKDQEVAQEPTSTPVGAGSQVTPATEEQAAQEEHAAQPSATAQSSPAPETAPTQAAVSPPATETAPTAESPSPTPAQQNGPAAATMTTSPGTAAPVPSATNTTAASTPASSSTPQAGATESAMATATNQATAEATATATGTATTSSGGSSLHFANCATRTGGNATVAVPADTTITGGLVLSTGDEIAIFTADGAICAGVAVWSGQNIAITAWGDDSQTAETDGLTSGQTMQFRIWDASAGIEYEVSSLSFSMGDGVYAADSIHAVSGMTVNSS